MKERKVKRLTWLTLILFCFTLFNGVFIPASVKAEEQSAVSSNAVAVLVGDCMESNNLGKNWDPANYNNQLTEYKNGIYEKAFSLKKGSYEYKIAMNGTWDESYCGENVKNDKTALELKEDTKVYFRLDLKNKKVYDSVNNPESFKQKAIVTGNIDNLLDKGQAWKPEDDNFKLDYLGGGIYAKTFDIKEDAQANEYDLSYKIAFNGAWGNGEIPGQDVSVKIPKGTKKITFIGDYLTGNVTDSIQTPEIVNEASLIGTVRGDEAINWKETNTDFDMHKIDATKFLYTMYLKTGEYEYKICLNHAWKVSYPGDNAKLKIAKDTNVVFIADVKDGKVYDSVNNADDVNLALGLAKKPEVVTGPVINGNGTVTFKYKSPDAKEVYLAGNMTSWGDGKQLMTKDAEGVWSKTLRVGDKAQTLSYKFIVDGKWTVDPLNSTTDKDGNSTIDFPEYKGRIITLPGSIETAVGSSASWDPKDDKMLFTYTGNGNYKLVLKNVAAGSYEYKIAVNHSWDPENYGLNGVDHGDNIPFVNPKKQDVTFLYNDDSHKVVNSVTYKVLDITLKDGEKELTKITDEKLNGIYSGSISLKAGTYNNLSLIIKDKDDTKTVKVDPVKVNKDKIVTFYFDPTTELCYNDASDIKIDTTGIMYNSRVEDYKKPYGSTAEGEKITFNLSTKKDMITEAKMIICGSNGVTVKNMTKNGTFSDGTDKWTLNYTPAAIGTYKYYFVVSNGSDVKAYGDDDGYFGKGTAGNIGEVKNYEFNIHTKDFKTPDWLKNGVMYQIYPDRFFNGDTTNDYLQTYSRGNSEYEFVKDWYSLPKDPELKLKDGFKYPENANVGDTSVWSNDVYGGDLKGIEKKVQYLKSLGVTILYLNPIGQSISSHRYDTSDYNKVDPLLGTMDDFVSLAKIAKANGMHIILDGVYNHVSDDSVYFDRYGKFMAKGKPLGAYQYWSRVYDLMNEKGLNQQEAEKQVTADLKKAGITDLHYKDWFIINNDKPTVDADKKPIPVKDQHYTYEGWWGFDSMPVIQALNGSEYNVKTWADEVIDGKDAVSRKYLRNGSNGWRLDVANEVSDETWRAFRKAVKSEGDNAVIGEIWEDATHYILGDMYDSVMNYRFRGAVINYVKGTTDDNVTTVSAKDSMNELEKMREQYPREALEAMMNLVGSHDTQRVLSALDGYQKSRRDFAKPATDLAKQKMRLIPFLQMTYVGAPTIYYGDEAGMVGCDDPDNRRAFIWGKGDKAQVEWYAKLAAVRSQYSSLRTGDVLVSDVEKAYADDVISYARKDNDSYALAAANRQQKDITVTLSAPGVKDGTKLTNILNSAESYTVKDGKVTVKIPSLSGVILVDKVKTIEVNYDGLKDAYEGDKVAERAIPKSQKAICEEIENAKDGSEVVISDNNCSISKGVLEKAANSKKNLTFVILRGDNKFIIKDVKALKEALDSIGYNDFECVVIDKIASSSLVEKVNNHLALQMGTKTNLKDGKLGTKVVVTAKVDKKYAGRTLYVYAVDKDGKYSFIQSINVKDNLEVQFTTDKLTDFVLLDDKIENIIKTDQPVDPGKQPGDPGNPGTTDQPGTQQKPGTTVNPENPAKTDNNKNPQNNNNTSNGNKNNATLVKTGSMINMATIIVVALVIIAAGVITLIVSKKRKSNK